MTPPMDIVEYADILNKWGPIISKNIWGQNKAQLAITIDESPISINMTFKHNNTHFTHIKDDPFQHIWLRILITRPSSL